MRTKSAAVNEAQSGQRGRPKNSMETEDGKDDQPAASSAKHSWQRSCCNVFAERRASRSQNVRADDSCNLSATQLYALVYRRRALLKRISCAEENQLYTVCLQGWETSSLDVRSPVWVLLDDEYHIGGSERWFELVLTHTKTVCSCQSFSIRSTA